MGPQTSCAETCENRGLTCDIVEQSKLTSESAMQEAMQSMGEECASFGNPNGKAGAPFTNLNTSSTKCFTLNSKKEAMAAVGYECRKFLRSRGGAGAPYTSGILIGNNYSAGRNNQCVMTTTTSSAPCNKTNFSNK